MHFLQTQKVKDGHEVWKHFQKNSNVSKQLSFTSTLPQSATFSQNDSTFGGFDDFGPFLA